MVTDWGDKRVLVTGGGGFLGSHVVEELREAGCREIVVVRSKDYDLTKEEAVARLFSDLQAKKRDRSPVVDVVIHLAGLVGGIGANKARPADFFYQNIMMGVLTMHYARKAGVAKVVAAGAGCGYPEHAPLPLKEESLWDGLPQQESAPYSLAKRMLTVQANAYWRQYRFPTIITIPGNIYGPYDNFDLENAHVIPALVRKFVEATDGSAGRRASKEMTVSPARPSAVAGWGTGTPTRDFVYAGDVAEGILRAAEVYDTPELVNLSSGTETSIRTVVETLAAITGFNGEVIWDNTRPDGQARRVFDVSKARKDLMWEARTSLPEGLTRTVEWYRSHASTTRKM